MLAHMTTGTVEEKSRFREFIKGSCGGITQVRGEQEADVVVEDRVLEYEVDDHDTEQGSKADMADGLHFHARLVHL